ncbi:MAG TPA: cupredoxin domain-containing protein [Acidimicrobiales bacterium]|nr:cupredoxin domain-containing protein [Acidimicrobiales bacterium]
MSRWNALVRLCAYVSAIVAVARGAAVGDRESIAVGLALVVAEFATHAPARAVMRLGWLGLAALFVNQGFWMVTAVVSLTTSAPSILGASAPALLSVTAVLGLVASLARLGSRLQGAVGPLILIGAATIVALVVAVPALGAGAVDRQAQDLSVTAADVKFEPERLRTHAGDIGIIVKNDDLFWHTLTISDLDANVTVATAGRRRLQLRDVAPGTYEFVCAIPGHESAGMTGELVVA